MSCNCNSGNQATLTAVQGDTFQRTFTLSTWNGTTYEPTDLTGATAVMMLSRADASHEHPLSVTDAAGGVITANVPASETTAWGNQTGAQALTPPRTVEWRLQVRVTFTDGVVQTIVLGTLCVHREATT